MPAHERERIFERFQRGSATGGEEGFGLGLAIGRELAERLGGRLELVEDDRARRALRAQPADRAAGRIAPAAGDRRLGTGASIEAAAALGRLGRRS